MSKPKFLFVRAYIDPKNGDIELYYRSTNGDSHVFRTNKNLERHIFDYIPEGIDKDELGKRIAVLVKA